MKLTAIKANPNNPRTIKDAAFEKLCKSIQEFPKMMELRPIVTDDQGVILGGNMRLKALQHLGFKDVPNRWKRKRMITRYRMKSKLIL
jgi:ParB-like chromosome segregation protein Spo0J